MSQTGDKLTKTDGKEQTPVCLVRRIKLVAEGILISNPLKVEEKEDFDIFFHENKRSLQTQQPFTNELQGTKQTTDFKDKIQRKAMNGVLFKNIFHLLLSSTCIFRQ